MPHLRAIFRLMTLVESLPKWARPVVVGATFPVALMCTGPLALLSLAIVFAAAISELGWVAAPLLLGTLLLMTVAGAAGGAAYSIVAALVRPTRWGYLGMWLAAMYVYLAVFAAGLLAAGMSLPIPFLHPVMLFAFVVVGALYAVALMWITYEPEDPYEFLNL